MTLENAGGESLRLSMAHGAGASSPREVLDWLAGRLAESQLEIEEIALDDLIDWEFEAHTGNLVHRSGKFFTVEGLSVEVTDRGGEAPPSRWTQPILHQPEHAILGFLMKRFEGVPHFLTQAKIEPGNANQIQLSPTVQATWSNYTGVHRGQPVRYVEHFLDTSGGRIVVDVLQSELGGWFYRKSNRNMIVEVTDDVPVHDGFKWLSLAAIADLLRRDNVVNMDARSVLACLPTPDTDLRDDVGLLSWFTGVRARYHVEADRIPLGDVAGWTRGSHAIEHKNGARFRIPAVSCRVVSREVRSWTQPLLHPLTPGLVCFLVRRAGPGLQVLVQARVEAGLVDTVELAPTVQLMPGDPPADGVPFVDLVRSAPTDRIHYDAVLSEEGGRFYRAESRYLVVEVDDVPVVPDDFRWVAPGSLSALIRHGRYLNVQTRTLLACLNLIETARGVRTW
jgi:dTDP-4-dehydro-6-deoxy-alpha-D-glucopyranose 2,3-dehydratase